MLVAIHSQIERAGRGVVEKDSLTIDIRCIRVSTHRIDINIDGAFVRKSGCSVFGVQVDAISHLPFVTRIYIFRVGIVAIGSAVDSDRPGVFENTAACGNKSLDKAQMAFKVHRHRARVFKGGKTGSNDAVNG